ncbi:MAG: hypothetical protein QY330_03545 [Candidatus Dojkabacteria bacterium]|uniref:Uncharacterized protein n=1 Tax=Candidatus Dojkabacteria bacterium TaxID=2099670 RepID=A0A952AJK6_9BACT|nr:hypothetical protein [Candidatus Dojkabacteria bacterium]WKZ27595.1 MAG: hypothetical protein QY330_03545 [Candidatus Dojkabacteria bacterium]
MDLKEKLLELLKECGEAHKKYEAEELGGKTDQDWQSWYATFLLERKFDELFEEEVTAESLKQSLESASKKHKEIKDKISWQEFFADYFLYDFT